MPDPPPRNYNLFASAASWIANGPRAIPLLTLGGILLAVDLLAVDVVRNFREALDALDPDKALFKDFLLPYFRKFYIIGLLFLVPAFIACLYRNRHKNLVTPLTFLSVALIIAWLPGEIVYSYPALTEGLIGEETSRLAFFGKIVLVFLLLASPPILAEFYRRSSIMDRYMLRCFLTPFSICLFAFTAIWLIIDLSDNGPDFVNSGSNLLEIAYFYAVQFPQVILLVMPVTILLSLLYALGKMSASNELVSMIGLGKSMGQIFAPIFAVGLYATFVCFVLNYQWAPWSEGHKESVLQKIRQGYEQKTLLINHLHHNALDGRTWFIGFIPFDMVDNPMATLEIRQHDAEGRLRETYYASRATWMRPTKTWRFYNAAVYFYDENGDAQKIETFDQLDLPDWRESPFKLVSSSFNPEHLGVPQLTSFLRTNRDYEEHQLAPFRAHWHYRWALPWSCFVVTLVAAPLGIVYSRRGLLGSVAGAVFIFFSMMFLEHFFLALGQGNHIPAFFSAWTNNFLFAAIGGMLFYIRSRNRNFSGLGFGAIRGIFSPPARASASSS